MAIHYRNFAEYDKHMFFIWKCNVCLCNKTKKLNTMQTTINFYEGSFCYNTVTTDLNVTSDYIEFKLATQYEYRETKKSLWAIVYQNNTEINRYELQYGKGLKQL